MNPPVKPLQDELTRQRKERAASFARTGIPHGNVGITLSEALVLGLLRQGVKIYFTVFGHGSTEVGEVLRIYQQAGLVKVYGVHSEIEASHAAAALRWKTNEKAGVVTSIGPGALQAMSASLVPASDGIGVWYLLGDETTEDEGYNMQQIPRHEQGKFLQMAAAMGRAYSLHTPLALPTALQRGAATVDHPYRPGPFFLLLPMNTQTAWLSNFNLEELPEVPHVSLGAALGDYVASSGMDQGCTESGHQSGRGWAPGRSGIGYATSSFGRSPSPFTDCLRLRALPAFAKCWRGRIKGVPMWKLRHGAR